jgi:hypothetical protein
VRNRSGDRTARHRLGPRSRCERGEALLLALFVLLMLGISLALLGLTMRVRIEEQQREVRRARLDLLLDGVVAETLAHLAQDSRFAGVSPRGNGVAGEGEAWSEVERLGPLAARVDAAAALGPRRAAASALVRLVPAPPRVVRWQRSRPIDGP